jgi:SAM-dependent methyltransferase
MPEVRELFVGIIARVAATVRAKQGASSQYEIFPGYKHRNHSRYDDDTALADEWQREVYVFAAKVMREEGLATIYDIGCGSGYKLMHYLDNYNTTGFDVEPTISFLREKYPDRKWRSVSFAERELASPDLIVCADVIEHVEAPDALLDFINVLSPRYIIISTPDRARVYMKGSRHLFGPPANPTHLREWSFAEFAAYIGRRFRIIEHRITNERQGTQMIFCVPAQENVAGVGRLSES